MARLPRICPIGIPQHVIQRGNNRQPCFADERDFAAYADWLGEAARKCGVAVHAWVFMTNHVHLLVTPTVAGSVSRMMQALGRRYVRYFNHTYRRTGTLWEGRFRSCLVEADTYLLTCQRYIEMNPVRAGMVVRPSDYHWSSFHANALGITSGLWTPHPTYLCLGNNARERAQAYLGLFAAPLDEQSVVKIRAATNMGLALGNDRFKEEIERLTGRRLNKLKRGPKPTGELLL
ncbi:transposase [Sulfurivermis fontis]|jgi:putative transposase|uniref:transposase n=1 Tax=Sulfurivermis fontis TaxID=1972068 RepID=UPI000FDA3264|nr:transposase [Sulfurivermis fontis]